MKVKVGAAAKALAIAVTSCVTMIPATAHKQAESTAQTAAAMRDGRAEIDAHVATCLRRKTLVG